MDNRVISFLLQLQNKQYLSPELEKQLKEIVEDFEIADTFQGSAEYWRRALNLKCSALVTNESGDTHEHRSAHCGDEIHIKLSENRGSEEVYILTEMLMNAFGRNEDFRKTLRGIAYRLVKGRYSIKNLETFLKYLFTKTDRSIHAEIHAMLDSLS